VRRLNGCPGYGGGYNRDQAGGATKSRGNQRSTEEAAPHRFCQSDDNKTYISTWWPQTIPTLIVSGADDRIVWQGAWEEPRFRGNIVMHRTIEGGAHFPWIENPHAVQQAFSELAAKVVSTPREAIE
jgi:pimeloyl-ACP methyl ester carboxylesterase